MANYLSVEEARELPGLRVVVTAHAPGLWSEATKNLFDAKRFPYILVEQVIGGENQALKDWTAQTSAPVVVWNDERPRSSWIEQIYLAERLAPEPGLIPSGLDDRALMFGLVNELAGENGFAWNMRLRSLHGALTDPGATEYQRRVVPVLAAKYGYDSALVDGARRQMVALVERLRDLLKRQHAAGRRYLIGDALTALDIYWATFAGAIAPLPEAQCPNMPSEMRAAYTDPELEAIAGEALLAHRDYVYRTYLKLPMDF